MKRILPHFLMIICVFLYAHDYPGIGMATNMPEPYHADVQECNCKGWLQKVPGSIVNASGQVVANFFCNESLSLDYTGLYEVKVPGYACSPETCIPTFSWSVKGPVSGSGKESSFNFDFSESGIYSVSITPTCGQTVCTICEFKNHH